MKIRRRHRKKGPLPLKYVLLITIITFVFVTYQSLNLINQYIEPSLIKIAETKAREFASQAFNKAIPETLLKTLM